MSHRRSASIHVVDDDDDVRDSLRALLESYGFTVETFASAAEFLGSPAGANPDCLLVDLQMPGMTGLALLETLRARGVATPALLITADSDTLGMRPRPAGILAVLQKPLVDKELLRWIERACALSNNP